MIHEEIRILLSALVDNELSPGEKRKVGEHLEGCAECRAEYSRLLRLKEVTSDMQYFDLPDRLRASYWKEIYNRLERSTGWILFSIGAILLLAFGAWELLDKFFLSEQPPLILKLGVGALLIGLIILLVSVGRERLFTRAHDRYEEVEI
jgi:predicted anti-sigma-YlaC factor YlaD